jgi:hypothetical protein
MALGWLNVIGIFVESLYTPYQKDSAKLLYLRIEQDPELSSSPLSGTPCQPDRLEFDSSLGLIMIISYFFLMLI